MTTLTIRRGLRRLEFQPQESAEPGSRAAHVVVEFATPTALTPGQTVQINLGIREGIERTLAGSPQLVKSKGGAKDSFLYRLEGDVG
jgi:hypothetical protein